MGARISWIAMFVIALTAFMRQAIDSNFGPQKMGRTSKRGSMSVNVVVVMGRFEDPTSGAIGLGGAAARHIDTRLVQSAIVEAD